MNRSLPGSGKPLTVFSPHFLDCGWSAFTPTQPWQQNHSSMPREGPIDMRKGLVDLSQRGGQLTCRGGRKTGQVRRGHWALMATISGVSPVIEPTAAYRSLVPPLSHEHPG